MRPPSTYWPGLPVAAAVRKGAGDTVRGSEEITPDVALAVWRVADAGSPHRWLWGTVTAGEAVRNAVADACRVLAAPR